MSAPLLPGQSNPGFPAVDGPQIAILFWPLATMPYLSALLVWLAITFTLCMGCFFAVWRSCLKLSRDPTIFVVLLGSPALIVLLAYGQISALAVVCVTTAYFALRVDRRFAAGVALGSLFLKPQLGLATAFVFVAACEWRIVLGAMTGAAAQLFVGALFWRPSILARYVAALVDYVDTLRTNPQLAAGLEPNKFNMYSWRAFFDVFPIHSSALAAYLIAAIVSLGLALACWKSKAPLGLRFAAFLLATILFHSRVPVRSRRHDSSPDADRGLGAF